MVRRKAKDYLKSGKKSRQASISSANNQSLSKSVSACGRIHARAVSPGVQLDVVRAARYIDMLPCQSIWPIVG